MNKKTLLAIPVVLALAFTCVAIVAVVSRTGRVLFAQDLELTSAGATGKASCTAAGRLHAFTAGASTVLPHESAEIAVNAPGLPEGTTVPCQVRLRYGRGLTVSWAGLVALPAAVRARIVHTGPGAYSVVPVGSGFLPWLIALLTVTVLFLAALAIVLRRQRQRRRHVG